MVFYALLYIKSKTYYHDSVHIQCTQKADPFVVDLSESSVSFSQRRDERTLEIPVHCYQKEVRTYSDIPGHQPGSQVPPQLWPN